MLTLGLVSLLAAAAQPPDAGSDGSPASPRTPVFYETTTVHARPVSSTTGSVTTLDSAEVEHSLARSLGDVLADVPGLQVLSSAGRAGVSNVFLRGADPNYTLVLLDGIPLNDATELQGGAVNVDELPAALVERVEIVRGPLTSFYGTSALAGVVQLFTARATPDPARVSAGLDAGDAALRRAFARAAGRTGRVSLAGGSAWEREEARIASERFRQLDVWGTADVPLTSASLLALSGRFADGRSADYPDASGGPSYGSGLLRESTHHDLALGARLEMGTSGARRPRIQASFARRTLGRTSPAVPPVVPESDEHTLYRRVRLDGYVPVVSAARTQVEAGLSGEGEWGRNASVLRMPATMGGDVTGDYVERRFAAGVMAAARHERGAFLYEAALRLDKPGEETMQANPHAGVVWRAAPGTTMRASLGRASKMPSFFALASPPALGGNPALQPEHVVGGEAGLTHRLRSDRLEIGATWFRQHYTNLVDFDFERFLHVNRARVRTQGMELSARWRLHPTLWLDGAATYLRVDDLESGGTLLHSPRWRGSGSVTWQPSSGRSLRLSARATEGYLDHQYPVPDRSAVDGHGRLGLAGSWRLGGGLALRLRADNLTNRRYETLIGFPGPGRSYSVGLSWTRHP